MFSPDNNLLIAWNIERADCPFSVSTGTKDSGVVSFKLFAMLGSFGVTICDDRSSIADIQIQGTCSGPKSESMNLCSKRSRGFGFAQV